MIKDWLKTLSIDNICQWDVLVFLHRHNILLVSAEEIARLVPYGTAAVVIALDLFESRGMVERSRLSQGARLYQLTEFTGHRELPFKELLKLTAARTGRLQIAEELREACHTPVVFSLQASKTPGNVRRSRRRTTLADRKEGGKWPKAI